MSPVQKIDFINTGNKNCQLYLKRDDLLDAPVSGNKWRKLKYLIQHILNDNIDEIVTWGGIFSNHLYACSKISKEYGINITAIVPTFKHALPPSLIMAKNNGLNVKMVTRSEFRKRHDKEFIDHLMHKHPQKIFLLEGGNSIWSDNGIGELVEECEQQIKVIDYWVVPVGSGGTLSGILSTQPKGKVIGINVVKGSHVQNELTLKFVKERKLTNWEILNDFEFGGMGKTSEELIYFINNFYKLNGIKLDPIYNGKMLYAIYDLINRNYFAKGNTICAIHTGGQSSIDNYNFKYPGILSF